MKQLTDEVFAQVRVACEYAALDRPTLCGPALAALDTAQPMQVNAMLVEAGVLVDEIDADLGYIFGRIKDDDRCQTTIAANVRDKLKDIRASLTAAQQAQPEPSEMTEAREAYIAGLESRTHEMRKKIEQLDYELRVARSSQERATYTPPKIIDPDAPHPCFN